MALEQTIAWYVLHALAIRMGIMLDEQHTLLHDALASEGVRSQVRGFVNCKTGKRLRYGAHNTPGD